MLDLLLEEALKKRDEILSKIQPKGGTLDAEFRPIRRRSLDVPLNAVDGGMGFSEYKGFVVYAIDAVCLRRTPKGLSEVQARADVDLLIPYWMPGERVKLYMGIMELRLALNAAQGYDGMVLLDGSLLNMIARPVRYTPGKQWLGLIASEMSEIERSVRDAEVCIASKELAAGVVDGLSDLPPEDVNAIVLFLEYFEYLLLMRELVVKHGDRVVSIAKRSQSRFFRSRIPDAALLELACRGEGYIVAERVMPKRERIKWKIPVAVDDLLSTGFTVSYAKLRRGGPVIKMEVPRWLDDEDIGELWSLVAADEVQGYPYVLMQAHRRAHVTHRDMAVISKVLGIGWARTGREFL